MGMKYSEKIMDDMAYNLKNYLDIIESFTLIEGLREEEYNDAVKTVRKLIKKLEKHKGDDVFDKERYIELLEAGKLDV